MVCKSDNERLVMSEPICVTDEWFCSEDTWKDRTERISL